MVIVSDTGPLLYLFIIHQIALLPALYDTIAIPSGVARELSHPRTPPALRRWFDEHPSWLQIHESTAPGLSWPDLDMGEREALTLAVDLHATLILTDDSAARKAAGTVPGLQTIGTIGILYQAAIEGRFAGCPDMASAFDDAIVCLRQTSFFFTARLDAAVSDLSQRLHQQ